MANEKKFLDSSGISHLWDRIEERYPNMDELGLIIDAIDEVKADKTDIVQADWNQNDETAPDYVKNRTHWVEEVLVDLISQTTLSRGQVVADSVTMFLLSSMPIDLKLDGIYIVNWMNSQYELVAMETNGAITLGNLSILEMGNDTTEPFLIATNPYMGTVIYTKESITEVSVSVKGYVDIIHKIDLKYLPEIQNKNILDGTAEGSVRTVGSKEESDEYSMGFYAFAEGYDTTASGHTSHAEGDSTYANGDYSHVEGYHSCANGDYSHAEGYYSYANGQASHAEGNSTHAKGDYSHAEGFSTHANGQASHAEGNYTKASSQYQHVQGKYNIEDTENKYAHIVGNGEFSEDGSLNSNAHTLDWNGNAWFAGTVKMGGTSQDDETAVEVATKNYVDEQLNSASSSSKLISHVLPIEATEENQTIFPINLETFDAANDTILVQDGITLLLPNSGFTIENSTIVMTTPWGLGDTGSILILKNTPVLEDEVTISGAVIENNSITLDKLSADITTELDEIKKSASDGKALVAGAITDKGIETAADATFETMANNIDSIITLDSVPSLEAAEITPGTGDQIISSGNYLKGDQTIKGDANLVASNIAKGKNIFGVTGTYDPVTGSICNTSDANAVAANILKDKTAYVNGAKLTGTMPNNGAVSEALAANGSYTIPKGYHDGTGKVTQSLTTQTATTWSPKTTAQTIPAGTYCSGAQTIAAITGTAAVDNVLAGKTFNSANGIGLTGTMKDNGAVAPTALNAGGSYTIPAGYHNGSGKVTTNTLANQTSGTAANTEILKDKTAWVNGNKVTGSMPNNGAVSQTLPANGSYTIPAGYHNGSGKITQSLTTKAAATITPGTSNQTIAAGTYCSGAQTIKGDSNLKAENIASGVSIFGISGTHKSGVSLNGTTVELPVADGQTITAGDFVTLFKGGSLTINDINIGGTKTAVSDSTIIRSAVCAIDDNRVAIAYNINSSSKIYCIVGSISGNTITFGTAISIGENSSTINAVGDNFFGITSHTSNRIIVTFAAMIRSSYSAAFTHLNVNGTTLTASNQMISLNFGTAHRTVSDPVAISDNVIAVSYIANDNKRVMIDFYKYSSSGSTNYTSVKQIVAYENDTANTVYKSNHFLSLSKVGEDALFLANNFNGSDYYIYGKYLKGFNFDSSGNISSFDSVSDAGFLSAVSSSYADSCGFGDNRAIVAYVDMGFSSLRIMNVGLNDTTMDDVTSLGSLTNKLNSQTLTSDNFAIFECNDGVVVLYGGNNNALTAIPFTVSGSSITKGTEYPILDESGNQVYASHVEVTTNTERAIITATHNGTVKCLLHATGSGGIGSYSGGKIYGVSADSGTGGQTVTVYVPN